MAKVQERLGAKGRTYRVELQRDGSRVSKTFRLKKEAEKFAALITLNADLANTLADVTLNTLSLQKAIAEYVDQHTGKDRCVKQRLEWWAKTIGNDKLIGKITKQDIKKALQSMLDDGMATATHNRYKSAISSVFEYVNDKYDTNYNPARQIKQLKEARQRERFASREELEWLFAAAKVSKWERLHLLVLMAVSTGARRSELLGLRWSAINFQDKTAYLSDTKNGTDRVLPLTDACLAELAHFREIGNGWLFPHPDDSLFPFKHFDSQWYAALKQAEITGLVFHGLRHTTGSYLAMSGAPLSVIKEVLGHKTIVTTQRYVHHSTENKKQVIKEGANKSLM
ncbi:tyrosine-type recombinase/integrase [Aeromonas salmonicida]|uniref:tyrosine-type recombinase/integrase n=1 Tax=Aeromonas salmonicida TaxID=645 RepID=UPI00073B30CB|nr:site-specific integrase [Aeromonas salmonicida]KTA84212.1 hypothetical protein VO70_11270 [Aeromonas salmonicida]